GDGAAAGALALVGAAGGSAGEAVGITPITVRITVATGVGDLPTTEAALAARTPTTVGVGVADGVVITPVRSSLITGQEEFGPHPAPAWTSERGVLHGQPVPRHGRLREQPSAAMRTAEFPPG